jgi:hypothetical protein
MNCLGYVVTEKAHPSAVSSPRKLVLLGDTCDSGSLTSVAQSADLLVHEATFLDADVDKAQRTGHSTTGMAGSFARSISARHLCLTHFSQRYLTSELATGGVEDTALETHREQAQHAAGGETHVHLAQDFLTLHIMPRTESAGSSSSLPMPQQREEKSSSEFSTTKTEHRSSAEASKATPTAASQPQPLHIAMPKKTRR